MRCLSSALILHTRTSLSAMSRPSASGKPALPQTVLGGECQVVLCAVWGATFPVYTAQTVCPDMNKGSFVLIVPFRC